LRAASVVSGRVKKLLKINKNNVTIFNEKKVTNYLHYGDNYIIKYINKKTLLISKSFPTTSTLENSELSL